MSDVIQSDREAFARVEGHEPGDMGWRMITEPTRGDCCGVVCIAKYRIASSADLRAKLDVAVEALRAVGSKGRSPGIGVTRDIADTALATIGDKTT